MDSSLIIVPILYCYQTALHTSSTIYTSSLSLNLTLQSLLQSNRISSKLADTLAELVNGHWVLVEVESEVGLVVNVRLLLDVKVGGILGLELLWDWVGGVLELLEEVWLFLSLAYAFCIY
jgi:hypothetical protein